MSYQRINLQAGVPYRLDIKGRLILVDSVGASDGVDLEILHADSSKTTAMYKRKAGFRMVMPFAGVILTCSTAATVAIFLSETDVQLGTVDGAAVTIPGGVRVNSTVADPVYVALDESITIGTVKVENKLVTIVDAAAVEIGLVAVSISNDPTLKKIRMRNMSDDALIAIGGVNVALGSPIILQPGEMYFEDDAAGAHLYAIADSEGGLLVIQGLK